MSVSLALPATAHAGGWPASRAARQWRPPAGWLRQALCIHQHESSDWFRDHRDWSGRWSPYSGGMQFLTSTWQGAGGTGEPWQWAPREQLYRAWRVWARDGGSFAEWGTRSLCV